MSVSLNRRQMFAGAALIAGAPALVRADTLLAAAPNPALPLDIAELGQIDKALEDKIARLADRTGIVRYAFAAVDVARGRAAYVREGELFPMQSLFKLPIAVAFMRLVETGDARLATKVRVTAGDIAPGRSPLAEQLRQAPQVLTLQKLMEHMLLNSDNTATDELMKAVGGPAKIQETLKELNIEDIRVDRLERELQPEAMGLKGVEINYSDANAFDTAYAALSEAQQRTALEKYMRDQRDTANARGIAKLLMRLSSGRLIQPRYADFILKLMRETKTGEDRLKAGLPKGWTFAHRGGTSATVLNTVAAFNDAGLAISPAGQKIIIVTLISGAMKTYVELAAFQQYVARAVVESWGVTA